MTKAQELIKKYGIKVEEKNGELTGRVYLSKNQSQKAMQEVRPIVDEIKNVLFAEWKAERAAENDRQEKINAIDGLDEILKAQNDLCDWERKFNASFDDVGGMGVGPKPDVDIAALRGKYQRADAYLKADATANKANFEISAIGTEARERIINEPDSYEEIINEMNQKLNDFAERHMFN